MDCVKKHQRQIIFLDCPEVSNFQPDEAIAYWDSHPTSHSKTGAIRAKKTSVW